MNTPQGQLIGTFGQLMVAGCIQAVYRGLERMFYGLMALTGRNPCNGCPIWDNKGPGCRAFQLYHTAYVPAAVTPSNVPAEHPLAGLSVKQLAAQLGVSISEVRRRKANGTL